jgi:hypothetical protein
MRGEHESNGAGGGWSEFLSGQTTLVETGQHFRFQSGLEIFATPRADHHMEVERNITLVSHESFQGGNDQ